MTKHISTNILGTFHKRITAEETVNSGDCYMEMGCGWQFMGTQYPHFDHNWGSAEQ